MSAYLELHKVTKRFGETNVLDGVDLLVGEGELVTLLGPSGCGKSTLLRCIAGLTGLDEGQVMLGGRELTRLPPREREVGMVFQSYALFPNMTAGENVEYGMRMRGASKRERAARAAELLALVALEEKRDAYPHQLSGGQQQRVALARSLAVQPKVLLLDEPLSALDAQIRKNLRNEIRDIQKRLHMTTLFVTHDQEEALTMSDRICIMNRGGIVQEGSPADIYAAPRTEFAARFMGSCNVLTRAEALRLFGAVDGPAETFALRPEAVKLVRPDGEGAGAAADEAAGGTGEPVGRATLEGDVRAVSVLGAIVRYTVAVDGVELTVDALNDRGIIGAGARERVRLVVDRSQLLQLRKEGA